MDHHDDNQNDATLVTLVLAGEREAFGPLLQRYYASVVRLCERLLGANLEAQDVAQEAALQAFLGLAQLQEPGRFGAWLHAIAANLARMLLRRRHQIRSLDALEDTAPVVVLWSAGPLPPEVVQTTREIHDEIVAALNDLSLVNREVAIGFYLEGYSYSELAALLGVPVSTIKGRLFFGRRQLRRTLQPLADEVLKPDRRQRKEPHVETPELIELNIDAIRFDPMNPSRALVLREGESNRYLPIWIGPAEADAIAMALEGQQPQRPMTHDLALRMLAPFEIHVQQVVVNNLTDNTFFADLTLTQGDRQHIVDARPSDAIALAVRSGVPIYVTSEVMAKAGITFESQGTTDAAQPEQPPNITTLARKTWVTIVAHAQETRDQLVQILAQEPDIEVVAQADSVRTAMEAIQQPPSGIVLIDVDLPEIDGYALAEAIRSDDLPHQVILLGSQQNPDLMNRAMLAGARQFLSTPVSADALLQVVRQVRQMLPAQEHAVIVSADVRQRIDQCLTTLLADTQGQGALLMSRQGSPLTLQGELDPATGLFAISSFMLDKLADETGLRIGSGRNLLAVRVLQTYVLALVYSQQTDQAAVRQRVEHTVAELETLIRAST